MKKLLISTLTALMLVGMVGCTHKVTIKVETPTIETETQKETETKTETQEEIQETTQETTQEETEEITEEETETETETQEEIQEITEEPCVEQPVAEEPVETYQETKKYIKTEEKVQYEYNPDWGYDPVLDCYFEVLPNTNFRYYKLDNETGKYDIVENSEPVDCGIAEKYEPEGYQPIITISK